MGIQPLGRSGQKPELKSGDWYGSGMLHPGQILRGSLPLLSPIFNICGIKLYSHTQLNLLEVLVVCLGTCFGSYTASSSG